MAARIEQTRTRCGKSVVQGQAPIRIDGTPRHILCGQAGLTVRPYPYPCRHRYRRAKIEQTVGLGYSTHSPSDVSFDMRVLYGLTTVNGVRLIRTIQPERTTPRRHQKSGPALKLCHSRTGHTPDNSGASKSRKTRASWITR